MRAYFAVIGAFVKLFFRRLCPQVVFECLEIVCTYDVDVALAKNVPYHRFIGSSPQSDFSAFAVGLGEDLL